MLVLQNLKKLLEIEKLGHGSLMRLPYAGHFSLVISCLVLIKANYIDNKTSKIL